MNQVQRPGTQSQVHLINSSVSFAGCNKCVVFSSGFNISFTVKVSHQTFLSHYKCPSFGGQIFQFLAKFQDLWIWMPDFPDTRPLHLSHPSKTMSGLK
jgi:hypothetical protein